MALYESLTAQSTPDEIAAAYEEFAGLVGGDTQSAQERAVDYLSALGISTPTIAQAYDQFLQPNSGAGALSVANDAEYLYRGLTSSSTPQEIANAYDQYVGIAGGDTQKAQESAIDYLTKLGVTAPNIQQAYGNYLTSNRYEDYLNANPDVKAEFERFSSQDPNKWTPESYGAYHLLNYGIPEGRAGGGFDAAVDSLTKQILDQGLTGKWSGEGFGSTEANARDMAKILAAQGITDINQFGVRDRDVRTEDVYNEQGQLESAGQTYKQPEYYNKATGQAIQSTYDKAQGPIWGGTFAGEGSTGYGVHFQPDGTPIFYSQYGGSSNDLAQIMSDPMIGSLIQGAASYFGGPIGTAALNLLAGKDVDDVAKAALTSYVAGQVASGVSGAEGVVDTFGKTGANIVGKVAGNVATGGGKESALQTLITGGVNLAAPEIANLVPGYDTLTSPQKDFVNSVISSTLRDGNLSANDLVNAAIQAGKAAERTARQGVGDLTNRVYDDTVVQAGADAFIRAKEIGASDEDAYAAANAAAGVVVSKIPESGSGNVVTTTYGKDVKDTEFGDLDGAIDRQTRNTAVERLVTAYEAQTGKTLDKLTEKEIAALSYTANSLPTDQLKNASIQDIINKAPAIVGKDDQGRWVDDKGYAYDERGFKYAPGSDVPMIEITGVGTKGPTAADSLDAAGGNLVNWANTLEGTSGDVVRQTLSTLIGAGGEQIADLGTALANMGAADRYNLLVQLGQSLERTGQNLEIPGVTAATKNFWNDIEGAETYSGKVAAALKSVVNNPLVLTQVAKEGFQEVLPIVTGGAVFKLVGKGAGIATDVLMNAAESMGSQSRQKFNEEIAKGTPVAEAEKLANADGWKAFAITAGTASLADAALVKGYERAMDKAIGKTATSFGKEWGEEGFEELAIALATGDDLATALTKSVVGSAIGSKTSGTLTAGANVSNDLQQAFASEGLTSTDGTFRPETIVKVQDAGATADTAGTAGAGTTTGGASVGADTGAANDFSVALDATGNATLAVDSSVGAAVSNGADAGSAITSVVDAAANAGTNANVAAAAAANAAVNAGADTTTASNAATTAVSNLTGGTTTGANTNTTTGTGGNTSTNAATGVSTNTAVDANTGTTTTTTTNANTGTNTSVSTNTNTGVTTTTNTNTNTGVNTNTSTNSNTGVTTNVVTNTNTGSTVTINTDTDTDEVVDVDTGGTDSTVIDADTVDLGDGVVIDITTGEQLTPEQVEERKKNAKPKLAVPKKKQQPGLLVGASGATPPYKPSDISETWLGGQFRNVAPFMALAGLLPENNPMFQEQQSLSALRRASGLDDRVEKPQSDYFSYGSEPSAAAVLAPYKRGGGVQDPAGGGKIMVSPLMAASGGDVEHKGSHYVQGAGGGQDDLIPAKLADGEYVFDAEIVAALGDGSNKEGARKLDEFREAIRSHKRSGSIKTIPPKAKSPLAYMKGIK